MCLSQVRVLLLLLYPWRLKLLTMTLIMKNIFLTCRYSTMMTKRRTLVIITIVWIAGGIGGAIPGFFRLILRNQGRILLQLMYGCIQYNVIPTQRQLKSIIPHFLFLMSLTVLLPSGIMLFTHAWIFTISRSQLRRIRVLEDAVSKRRSSEMRAAKTVAVTVFSALACFTPLVVVNFITALDPPSGKKLTPTQINIKYILFPSLKILYLLAVTLNPFICALKTRPFKETFKKYLRPLQIRLGVSLPTTLNHSGAKNIELATTKNRNIEIARSTVL